MNLLPHAKIKKNGGFPPAAKAVFPMFQDTVSTIPDEVLLSTQRGVPGEFLLLFTVLVWVLFLLIFLGNAKSRLNQWCFFSGMCFSLGVCKEYLYFSLFPYLYQLYQWPSYEFSYHLYSVLTAVFYYVSMPTVLIFSFYFSRLDERKPLLFSGLRFLVFLPALFFFLRYPCLDTRYYQLYDSRYYASMALYNLIYGVILTWIIVLTLIRERGRASFRQKKVAAVLTLLPIWYELLSAYLIHLLRLKEYFKAWQGNMAIILFLLVYFFYHASKDGFMGIRFHHENFDWNQEELLIHKNASCIQHMLKNELAKIEWCAQALSGAPGAMEAQEYPRIILRSTEHLKNCLAKSKRYSQDILLKPGLHPVRPILEESVSPLRHQHPQIQFLIHCPEEAVLSCDREYLEEVLNNLLANALEAMGEKGAVTLSFSRLPGRRGSQLTVADTGCGIPPEEREQLFTPYHTTKTAGEHMGMGLYFCRRVLEGHGGSIQADSVPGAGTTFTLTFPASP